MKETKYIESLLTSAVLTKEYKVMYNIEA